MAPPNYSQMLQAPAPTHIQMDIDKEGSRTGQFPALPKPQLPWETTASLVTILHRANWTPARELRPTVGLWGGLRGNMMPQANSLNIRTKGKLDQYIAAAHISGSWAVYSNMHTYVQEAHLLAKEVWSPLQNAAPGQMEDTQLGASRGKATRETEWPEHTSRDKHPQTTDPPEEWARWLWRYPREVAMCPGIFRARYWINLSSVRGMLMVMVRAPHRVIAHHTQSAFLICVAQLISHWDYTSIL